MLLYIREEIKATENYKAFWLTKQNTNNMTQLSHSSD